jgi:hypothetical protein
MCLKVGKNHKPWRTALKDTSRDFVNVSMEDGRKKEGKQVTKVFTSTLSLP